MHKPRAVKSHQRLHLLFSSQRLTLTSLLCLSLSLSQSSVSLSLLSFSSSSSAFSFLHTTFFISLLAYSILHWCYLFPDPPLPCVLFPRLLSLSLRLHHWSLKGPSTSISSPLIHSLLCVQHICQPWHLHWLTATFGHLRWCGWTLTRAVALDPLSLAFRLPLQHPKITDESYLGPLQPILSTF